LFYYDLINNENLKLLNEINNFKENNFKENNLKISITNINNIIPIIKNYREYSVLDYYKLNIDSVIINLEDIININNDIKKYIEYFKQINNNNLDNIINLLLSINL